MIRICKKNHEYLVGKGCRICANESSRLAVHNLRKKVVKRLREFKLSKGCFKCGYKESVLALQFDHINPRTDTSRHWKTPENYVTMKTLMDDPNIQVLCANCHCIKTHENKDYLKR